MPSASLLLKCLLGAGAVLLIALLSRSRSFFIAGMVPLFPTLALIAHYIVGTERSAADLRATALFGLFALFPYAVYLGLVFLLSVRTGLATTLFAALAGWFVAAGAVLLLWTRYTAPSF
jgi:membrane protein GlpM